MYGRLFYCTYGRTSEKEQSLAKTQGQLYPSEQTMLEKYHKAFSWRFKGFSSQHVKQMLLQDEGTQYAQAASILQEETELCGRVDEIENEGTKFNLRM